MIILCYTVPEIWCVTDVTVIFHFHLKKFKKTPRDIIILHMCTKNYDQMMYDFGDMVRNGRTDGESDI